MASLEVDNINAQADLTGSITPLINQEVNFPFTLNRFAANSGAQNVNAQGDLTLSEITSNLDIANTNLNVAANIDFDRLPISQALAAVSQDNQLIADSVNITGKATFDGQFKGKQVLSAPNKPGNVNLTGKLRLLDFAFNNITFDPEMAGQVNVQPGHKIVLNLQGKQDIIAARAVSCTASNCRLPYLPTNLELRQGENTPQPVITTGKRTGNLFSLDIHNFPLALLNLAPAKALGVEGALGGTTTGKAVLNLYTLAARGDIKIANPAISYIQADRLDANFNYDPANNIAEINNSSLDLGNSKYNFNAALDFKSGAINGKLGIPQAYIQDILTALRWFSIEDIAKLFNFPNYAVAASVKPSPIEKTGDRSIARQLKQLGKIDRQIQANAAGRETGGIPTELDIQGKYTGEIVLGGTIQTPEADFRVEGRDWQWQPKAAFPNIVEPLGLVIEETQYIAIPKVLIAGDLQGTRVDLAKAEIQLQDAVFSLKGKLSPEAEDAQFAIANLTVDNISNFVKIPLDLEGKINAIGTIKGTLTNPQLAGKVAFSDGSFNGQLLPTKIAGNFDYNGSELAFNTTAPDSIKVEATIPYPIIPGKSDRLNANVDIGKEAFVFLNALSKNYLNWISGEGDATLKANAKLDLNREEVIYDLDAKGVVNLEDANIGVETPFFSEPFIGTGKITINNQIVNVETLDGSFAEKDLSVTGKLPLLRTVENLDSPLTINIPQGKIDIERLYTGGIAGKVTLTGTSLKPVIGGKVNLEKGRVSIPKHEAPKPEDIVQIAKSQANNTPAQAKSLDKDQTNTPKGSTAKSSFITSLNNLQVNLQDFNFKQAPLYEFKLNGNLTLNGTIDQPKNIIPRGTIRLARGDVNLLSSNFYLARQRENKIVFTPKAGIFNPSLDLVFKTKAQNIDDQKFLSLLSVDANSNEIADPISNAFNRDTVRINLAINGQAAQILPNLALNSINCNIRPNNTPLVENRQYYTKTELNRLTQCFNVIDSTEASDRKLINSSPVQLTSVPALDEGEIINLLTDRFLDLADQVKNASQAELFNIGFKTFVLTPLIDRWFYTVEDKTVGFGKKVGLDFFTVYPDLEATYKVDQNDAIRSTYNYTFNEVKVQYQRRLE